MSLAPSSRRHWQRNEGARPGAERATGLFGTASMAIVAIHQTAWSAMTLASHWHQQDRNAEAKALLSPVIETWPRDLNTPDLRDAREVFAMLG